MERVTTILLILFLSYTGYSQQKPITKKELKTLIKEGMATGNSYSWEICNDSTAISSDTLIIKIPQVYECANFTRWHFRSHSKIAQSTTKREIYTTSSGSKEYIYESTPIVPSAIFKIKIIEIDNKLVLKRYNNGKQIDSFQIIGYGEKGYNNATILLFKQ